MGHRNDDALSALRAYARDLDATPGSGSLQVVGGSDQDGAYGNKPGSSGAPHQLAIAAVAVGVVLIGSIGIVSARSTSGVNIGSTPSVSQTATAQPTTPDNLAHSRGMANAAKAYNSIGLVRTAAAIESAITSGMDASPAFMTALEDVRGIVASSVLSGAGLDESVEPLEDAVLALESSASRPPGLDADTVPPGQGGTPPGQDPTFTPPGQDPTFTPPGQDPTFTPPGQSGDNDDGSNATNGSDKSQQPDKSEQGGGP